MNKSKELNTPWYLPQEGIKVWLAKVALGVIVLAIWTPVATALSIPSGIITVSFVVAFTVFWVTSAGKSTEHFLDRVIRREG